MNHRPRVLNSTSALKGFLLYKSAEGLSPATVFNYERELKLWLTHMGDQDIGKITSAKLLEFLNYLRSEYVPRCIAGRKERKLSDKTINNFYVSLSAFLPSPGARTWTRHLGLDKLLREGRSRSVSAPGSWSLCRCH